MMKYYLLVDGKTLGPLTLKQVQAIYLAGKLEASTKYATEGAQDWMPLEYLVPLFDMSEATSEPTPPLISQPQTPTIIINNTNTNNSHNQGYAYVQPNGPGRKSRCAYILLAIFLGLFGIHNFYAGRNKYGAIQLIMTILGAPIGLGAISWVWAWVECFAIRMDGKGIPME